MARNYLLDAEVDVLLPGDTWASRVQDLEFFGVAPSIYYVIGPDSGWADPTPEEVVAGQLSGGGAATAHGFELAPLLTTDPFTFTDLATGLTGGTDYRIAYVWHDGESFSDTVEVSAPFTTDSAGRLKVWLSGSWLLKPVKVWLSGSWQVKPLKVWNGAMWA